MTSFVLRGRVRTMDRQRPRAEAVAVRDGRTVAVGSLAEARAAIPGAAEIDHGTATILPALLDAHNHHAHAGAEDLFRLSFPPIADVPEIVAAVRAHAEGLPAGEWVVGGLWGSGLVGELSGHEPLAALDAVSGERPVLLTDDSHHNKWANTAAMRAAGILDRGADPDGGAIVRSDDGRPTGLLLEAAGALVEAHWGASVPRDAEYHARCSERGIELLAEHGIVGFQDAAASLDTLGALRDLDRQGRLKAWVTTSALINDNIFGTAVVGEELLRRAGAFATEHHRPIWSKIFLDGVPPTRTGAFLEPYLPDGAHGATHRGVTTMPLDELEHWLEVAEGLGLGVKVHCTGDASVREVLDAVERVRARGSGVRVQIAHGQFVASDDVPRFARLGVVAEISPFLWFPGVIPDALAECLPARAMGRIHPNRDLLDAGATVVVGSDWPVSESPNPWHAVAGLVTRTDPTGVFPGVLGTEQAVSREEALRAVTCDSADAMGLGDVTGRIRVGNSADFAVLDRDPLDVALDEIAGTRVDETWFAGERVHTRVR